MFHHLEVRQKYSSARRIFNSLLGASSGDETLHLMFDILLDGWGANTAKITVNVWNCGPLGTAITPLH